jgi:hypothetical protein
MHQPTSPTFDKALLQPTRLAVVVHLLGCGGETSFALIRAALGNVSHSLLWSHSQVLAHAGYIEVRKQIVGRQVRTSVVLTDLGRRALADHRAALTVMEDVA